MCTLLLLLIPITLINRIIYVSISSQRLSSIHTQNKAVCLVYITSIICMKLTEFGAKVWYSKTELERVVFINDEMYKKFEEDMQPQQTIRYFEMWLWWASLWRFGLCKKWIDNTNCVAVNLWIYGRGVCISSMMMHSTVVNVFVGIYWLAIGAWRRWQRQNQKSKQRDLNWHQRTGTTS